MRQLHFPGYRFRTKSIENSTHIFDPIRKKFFLLQPEEWVRQHVLQFLIQTHHYPVSLIAVEKHIRVAQTDKRFDVVVYKPDGSIFLLIECKAPEVPITQEVFDQAARYNLSAQAEWLMLTNGLTHVYYSIDYVTKKCKFVPEIPAFSP